MHNSSKLISVRNYPLFPKFWQSKLEFKWNIATHRMFIYVPTIPTDKFILEVYQKEALNTLSNFTLSVIEGPRWSIYLKWNSNSLPVASATRFKVSIVIFCSPLSILVINSLFTFIFRASSS